MIQLVRFKRKNKKQHKFQHRSDPMGGKISLYLSHTCFFCILASSKGDNNPVGTLPSHLGMLRSMKYFRVPDNDLFGSIQKQEKAPTNIKFEYDMEAVVDTLVMAGLWWTRRRCSVLDILYYIVPRHWSRWCYSSTSSSASNVSSRRCLP